jgi:signal transduction histidine kinase/sensor domain CHASE-containing protein
MSLCALGATLALSRVLTERERKLVAQRTDGEARHVAAQLRTAILKSVEVLPRMAEWWLSQGRPDSREDWETDAQLFLREEPSLREVVWLNPRGRAFWCVQPGKVPDFRCQPSEPDLIAAVRQASTSDAIALSRVELRQGVSRLYACKAVRRGKLVGFIAAAFDGRELVGSVLKEQLPADYGLQIASGGYVLAKLKSTGISLWPDGARRSDVNIAHTRWSVELTPAATDISNLQRIIWGFGLVVTFLISACTGLALIYRRNESKLEAEVLERRKAEETIVGLNRDLQHQLIDFRTLLDVIPVGIAVSNDDVCHDIWVNPALAGMLQMSVEQNVSRTGPTAQLLPYKLFHNGVEVPVSELPMQVAAHRGTNVVEVELDIVRADGSVLNTLSYAAPVFDQNGKVRRVINACVDITDRKRAEEQRKELEVRLARVEKYRSLGLMAGGIAHDFNNLLTAIIGHAELAQRDLAPYDPAAKAIQDSLIAANRAAELVSQLLAYTGRSWFEFKEMDISAEIHSLTKRLRGMMPAEVQIDFDLAPDLPAIQAGSREVYQVLRNLINNAIEAIGEAPGSIHVCTGYCMLEAEELSRDFPDQDLEPGEYVRLEVQDSGGGIPCEVARQVFDPFFTTKFLGRGLGLSAVQGIMRAHHGGVRFDASYGHGARVQAIFPVKVAERVRDQVA